MAPNLKDKVVYLAESNQISAVLSNRIRIALSVLTGNDIETWPGNEDDLCEILDNTVDYVLIASPSLKFNELLSQDEIVGKGVYNAAKYFDDEHIDKNYSPFSTKVFLIVFINDKKIILKDMELNRLSGGTYKAFAKVKTNFDNIEKYEYYLDSNSGSQKVNTASSETETENENAINKRKLLLLLQNL